VVGFSNSDIGGEVFIWDEENGIQSLKNILEDKCGLDMTGWSLFEGYGVSDDGLTIVGCGVNPDGFKEGFIATIPEPTTISLLALGALSILRKRKQ
jgi:hypothetical protein